MKPSLVEYEKIFKKKAAPIEVQINPKSIPVQIDNYHFFFNVFSIIIVISGILLLYNRKRNKEKNKRLQTQRIIQLYHDTNKIE
jgi:hypothetical protein